MSKWKNSRLILKIQLKNNRKMLLAYGILYLIAVITVIVLSIGPDEVSAWYKYMNCVGMAHIWVCVLSFFPALYCVSEMMPYLKVSRFRWGRRDLLLYHLVSLCLPAALYLIINLRFYGERVGDGDIAWCYWRIPAANLVSGSNIRQIYGLLKCEKRKEGRMYGYG